MPAYTVELAPAALRQLKKLEKQLQKRIAAKIDSLQGNPRPHGAEKLEGADFLYRVRVGDYRIVYQISDKALVVLVVRIGDRKDVYR